MAFWIVGASDLFYGEPIFRILDDEDGIVEELTKEQIYKIQKKNPSINFKYQEGSIKEKGKWVGKKTWDGYLILCYSRDYGGYYILKDGHIVKAHSLTQDQYIRDIWKLMQRRCTKIFKKSLSYHRRGIYIDDSFKDFNNFLNWFKSQPNFKYLKEAKLQIDKDLKGKGYYGADSCVLLPSILNKLLADFHCKGDKKSNLPLGCRCNAGHRGLCVEVEFSYNYKHMVLTHKMKDTSYSDEYILNMMQEFMNDRGIKTWNYTTSIIDVGRKWLAYKKLVLEKFYTEAKKCYDKGWITLEIYNLCLAYDIKITD